MRFVTVLGHNDLWMGQEGRFSFHSYLVLLHVEVTTACMAIEDRPLSLKDTYQIQVFCEKIEVTPMVSIDSYSLLFWISTNLILTKSND